MHFNLKNLQDCFAKLNAAITQSAKYSEVQMIPFGIFGSIAYLFYYLINTRSGLISHEAYDSLCLRVILSVLCLILILKNHWPKALRPFLPLYWHITLLYSVPFFITFMALKNHASSPWVLNLLSIVILMMLLVDWVSFTVLFIMGGLLAWLAAYLTSSPFVYIPGTLNLGDIVNTFGISIIMGIIFSRNKENYERVQAMAAVAGSIAHELRTPLLTIDNGVAGLKKYFPILFSTYQYGIQNGWPIEKMIRSDHLKMLPGVLDDISAETRYSNVIIDMLLKKVSTHMQVREVSTYPIRDCIRDALQRYPFQSTMQASLVTWTDANMFDFKGSKILVVHVLFNLLKNALFFIEDAGKGRITIWTEKTKKTNTLHFKDTAKGIAADVMPHLFKRFHSTTLNGTGLGLSFCKMVMTSMGGDITCYSQEGAYTEFVLIFPREH